MDHYRIAVIGAGLYGLTTAYYLNANGYRVQVFEKGDEPGGIVKTFSEGGWALNQPIPFAVDNNGDIAELLKELDLQKSLLYSNSSAGNKFILRNNQLHLLPTNLSALFGSKLLSGKAKFSILWERFKGKPKLDSAQESVSDFIRRRTCSEVLEYIFEPLFAENYAGNPDELSLKEAYPKLYELERTFGGLLKGASAALKNKRNESGSSPTGKLITWKDGLQELPRRLASHLINTLSYYSDVIGIEQNGETFKVTYNKTGKIITAEFDAVISTIPAHSLQRTFSAFDDFPVTESTIPYTPAAVLHTIFDLGGGSRQFDGYGVLIPRSEKKNFIAAVSPTNLFPELREGTIQQFFILAGGTGNRKLFDLPKDEMQREIMKDFRSVMEIDELPLFTKMSILPKAIPQYTMEHRSSIEEIKKFENDHPGIFIHGNFRGGITFGDTIGNAKALYNAIELFFSKRSLEG